ncbi:MAG: acetate--CoA ligase [Acidimicrobiaceae bacterium]|nr:MAG: acetyl-CoA synthetase [marine actinobacterium MedAcidi-G2A]MAT02612.1 acetate--CoA ligase [Acidimicrobiaceae bacterium]MAT03409.1 acetate--CoA ligase [Acidimicrobiaceae bacterium]MBA4810798.1 acetate--CoA ligase [Acidimicrobiales bacterium]OUV01809.1 MAG: acetyl-coenzyme A synthetase [Acidimicrobiaceae bacterium TMED77]|tara:strand:- start:3122 stop:5119 length:1998 start_codon:yes stop_codon:yes gene_type:complete
MADKQAIEEFYVENRTFPPLTDFADSALINDDSLYEEANANFEAFWARQSRELLTWEKDFSTILEWDLPYAKWFSDGELNISYNCLDRHVENGKGDKIAFHWEGEPGDTKAITYSELLSEVSKFANVLKNFGLERGDTVAIYMPMILELPIAMLACARVGVVHSVIFGGFSPDAIVDRCEDAEAKLIITADAGYRRGDPSPLKVNVDAALASGAPTVQNVVVVDRCNTPVEMQEGRDHWWHNLMMNVSTNCPAEPMPAEQLLYLLYTSGTTAKPKGIMHTSGGYLTQVAFTHKHIFDLQPETDIYWCAADIGWVTGHSYIVYGPLTNGCTSVMYEGTPDTPREDLREGEDRQLWLKDRLWDIIERYKVTQFYTAPTAIRTFMKWGNEETQNHDLSSLRVLGTVGEPINPEAWMWYHENIGGASTPIVDTWWQTETGGHMITPLPGVTTTKPGSACFTIPGVFAEVVDDEGKKVTQGGGYLTITKPWPAMLRGIWGDPKRYLETYWSTYKGKYFAGDGVKIDSDGYLWLLGRVDDVMNISGHRISTAEVESALVDHPSVAEAAVVGATDETTGQAIIGYVILRGSYESSNELRDEIRSHVAEKLGPIARPKAVFLVPDLPKTRSGKIMRRLLRDVAEGRDLGDTTTLADANVVTAIQDGAQNSDEN